MLTKTKPIEGRDYGRRRLSTRDILEGSSIPLSEIPGCIPRSTLDDADGVPELGRTTFHQTTVHDSGSNPSQESFLEISHSQPPSVENLRSNDLAAEPPETVVNADNGPTQPQSPTPNQFSIACQTEEESDWTDCPIKLLNAIGQLVDKQSDVSVKRLQVRELRLGLRYKRYEEAGARGALTKKISALSAQRHSTDIQSLHSDFEKLEAVTNAYLELERNYHQAEEELETEEWALMKLNQKVSHLASRVLPAVDQADGLEREDLDSEDSASTISAPLEEPPSLHDYLSRMGDAQIQKERIADLDSEYYEITERQSARDNVDVPINDESLEFLRLYGEKKRLLQEELKEISIDMARLRAICEEEGLLDEQPREEEVIAAVHDLQLEEFAYSYQPSEPLHISELEDPAPFFQPGMSKKVNTAEFISKWILHQLRHSRVEIFRLQTMTDLCKLKEDGWDPLEISDLVLAYWDHDDTKMRTPPRTATYNSEWTGLEARSCSSARVRQIDDPMLSKSSSLLSLRL
ncbi:hypothetical protein ASPZODRAFT_142024 [Penicilliopsis zonata CBS 506.65]|uniref:Uncharacterized protein n=1 Tax=Penicilliopsis zonata CBS 506.65 TaxID=1073090 RepID=A0A1L9SJ83_9EURO|nr:hypothetical protein ASPZODRAFT_142024 [Penicilliopsis zonata CBS 506.65]OJJ47280.1 hypothetical protein ASPZODRAFT_142024 [Penicilliopsis zonata CBS 506.65]